jgi:hypothetical protein
VEKLVYLLWAPPGSGPEDHARIATALAGELLVLGPQRLWMQVDDADAQVPVPLPPPEGEAVPMGVVSIWLDRYDDRGPFEAVLRARCSQIAGYLVLESLYTDYGGNRHSGPRDWPDGERSPGVTMVTLMERPDRLSPEEWVTHWHTVQSPVSESMQPRTRYVRNEVVRPVTPDAPPYRGIVEECWPSAEHVTDPMLFYCADGDSEVMGANLREMLSSVTAFLYLDRIRSITMSEYLLKTR